VLGRKPDRPVSALAVSRSVVRRTQDSGAGEGGAAEAGAGEGARGVAAAGTAGLPDAVGLGEALVGAGTVSRMLPWRGRTSERPRLVTMKSPASTAVARESTLAEPRGPKAVWLPPPPKASKPPCRRSVDGE
jgi:hypothetical protein